MVFISARTLRANQPRRQCLCDERRGSHCPTPLRFRDRYLRYTPILPHDQKSGGLRGALASDLRGTPQRIRSGFRQGFVEFRFGHGKL
jgi:hypothetical protein